MNDWEEKACQLCCGLAGLYHRREHLILSGEQEKAKVLEPVIRGLISDIKLWLEKCE